MNQQSYFSMIPVTALVAAIVVIVLAGAVPIWIHSRNWATANGSCRRLWSTRLVESLILAAFVLPISFMLLQLIAADGGYSVTEMLIGQEISQHFRTASRWALGLALLVGLVAMVCSLTFSTIFASMLIGVSIGFAVKTDDKTRRRLWIAHAESQRTETKLDRIRFETADPLNGAELFLNGVSFGTLPCETSYSEIVTTVPDMREFKPPESVSELFGIPDYRGGSDHRYSRWAVTDFKQELLDVYQRRTQEYAPMRSVRAAVDYQGMKGFTFQKPRPSKSGDGVSAFPLQIKFREWEADIQRLIDRARLQNYQVSPAWYESLVSYDHHGWFRLYGQSRFDPGLEPLLDECARLRYGINDAQDAGQAWDALMRIAEASRNSGYGGGGYAGHAVKLLAGRVDSEQLAAKIREFMDQRTWPLHQSLNRDRNATTPFYDSNSRSSSSTPEGIVEKVLFHAAWLKDRGPNKLDSSGANVIEKELTTAFLRQSYRHPRLREYAEAIGGPAWEQFVWRQDNKTKDNAVPDTQPESIDFLIAISRQPGLQLPPKGIVPFGSEQINAWRAKLIFMDSPAGREYRQKHRDVLLQLAARSIGPVKRRQAKTEKERTTQQVVSALLSSIPSPRNKGSLQQLDFLFLDRPGSNSEPSMAMEFWPYFNRMVETMDSRTTTGIQQQLTLRWTYLAKMWPESNVQMFVDAYPEYSHHFWDRQWEYYRLYPLPDADRFDILNAVEKRFRTKLPRLEAQMRKQAEKIIAEIQSSLAACDLPEAASVFVDHGLKMGEYDERAPRGRNKDPIYQLRKVAFSVDHHDRVDVMAVHDNPELRLIALSAIRHHPIPRRVKLLGKLTSDSDSVVKAAAIKVRDELKTLSSAPLPKRPSLQAVH